jgi:hypothetical protein
MTVELKMPFSHAIDAARNNFDATSICTVASYIFMVLTRDGNPIINLLHLNYAAHKDYIRQMHATANLLIGRGADIEQLEPALVKTFVQQTALLCENIIALLQTHNIPKFAEVEHFMMLLETSLSYADDAMDQFEREKDFNASTLYEENGSAVYQNFHDDSFHFSPLTALNFAHAFGAFMVVHFDRRKGSRIKEAFKTLEEALNKANAFEDDVSTAAKQETALDILYDLADGFEALASGLLAIKHDNPFVILAAEAASDMCRTFDPRDVCLDDPALINPATGIVKITKGSNVVYPAQFLK